MNRRSFLAASAGFPAILSAQTRSEERPNILWILSEDHGPQLTCYGHPALRTPNIDRLAATGVRFSRAFTTAPVCSASRSAFNTGVYQTSTGAHHHRSHRTDGFKLPSDVRLISHRMKDAGYFTANILEFAPGVKGSGKTDLNFNGDKPFEGTHWNQRKPGQPFYAQVNFTAPHKGPAFVQARKQKHLTDPASVPLPPYYPDHPVVRDEVANFHDAINLLDTQVGVLLEKLDEDKLLDNTIIFFFGDNGTCLIRGKQWLYDRGIHVPLIARFPDRYLPKDTKPGTVRDDLAIALDITATSLDLAGIPIPSRFDGRPLFGSAAKPREHIIAARDRCDMTMDRIRCVRDSRYKFIRNFMPERPYTQYNNYIQTQYPTLGVMQQLFADGKLNDVQSLFMQPRKPEIEFYDTQSDPWEVKNLANAPEHASRIKQMSATLDQWIRETGDKGAMVEPDSAKVM